MGLEAVENWAGSSPGRPTVEAGTKEEGGGASWRPGGPAVNLDAVLSITRGLSEGPADKR